MNNNSFLVIGVDLDYAIGTFTMPSNSEIKILQNKLAEPIFERIIYYMPY